MKLTADDVMVPLLIHKFHPRFLVINADYEFEGLYTGVFLNLEC